jgi:hypothetical protein
MNNAAAACRLYCIRIIRHGYICPSDDGQVLEALFMKISGHILYRVASLK